jgi:PHP family Zn ribbon phosphoesterase
VISEIDTCRDCGRDLRFRSHAPDCPQLVVRCEHCGQRVPQGMAEQIDVSTEDEYYPEFIHLCAKCAGDGGEPA